MQNPLHPGHHSIPSARIFIRHALDAGDYHQHYQREDQTIFHGGSTAGIPQYLRKE